MARRSDGRRFEERSDDEEDELSGDGPFGVRARANGPNTMIALLICVCFSGAIFLGWIHHRESQAAIAEMNRILNEIKYVISLPEDRRGELDIAKPQSLRTKRRNNQEDQ